jgi:hypothetical protein
VRRFVLNYATMGISLLDTLALIKAVSEYLESNGCSMDTATLVISVPSSVDWFLLDDMLANFVIGWVESRDGLIGGGTTAVE